MNHVILECKRYETDRFVLKWEINEIWSKSKKSGNLNVHLNLLLNPSSSCMNESEAIEIDKFVWKFIKNSGIKI